MAHFQDACVQFRDLGYALPCGWKVGQLPKMAESHLGLGPCERIAGHSAPSSVDKRFWVSQLNLEQGVQPWRSPTHTPQEGAPSEISLHS